MVSWQKTKKQWGHPLFFSVKRRPTDPDFRVFKKKKSYAEGNDTSFQTIFILIWNISNCLPYRFLAFSLFSFDSNNAVDFSFLHCRHVDFVATPFFFQA